ncbi:PQQ-binding-like beta-propeller repeat protein [Actinopolymorpha pittospori]|uniref:Outer membrane protein assembly factor BamB n=1 Tax=Actinopolymorpha pittospori TaxID=648752 RepID=A0A927MV90_9ACTN|nr:PQQ-binding-like beta-propeller repeat protein [Actinopolymorpha pittospori]MBE1607031.1 outer membrane protein assembly factor BamB [Actinopolymorpha pittospori]
MLPPDQSLTPGAKKKLRLALTAATSVLAGLVVVPVLTPVVAEAVDPPKATITGVVFADKNKNGTQDKGERGIKDVSVSDGLTIVRTDRDGAYRFETDPERRITDLVFITQPVGYSVGMDESSTPRFYRDLGQLADDEERAVDFALVPDPKSRRDTFTFANIADPHVNPGNPLRTAQAWTEQMKEIGSTQDLAFVQVSGDLTDRATEAEFETYRAGTAASHVPVWPAVGNHDVTGGTGYSSQIDIYRRQLGPEWYSFDHGNRHFVVVENNGRAPFEEQFEWVRQDLAANAVGKKVVLLTHQPLNVPFGASPTYDRYVDLFGQYDTELVLVGHAHSNDVDGELIDGAKHVQTNSSSYTVDQTPTGFRYVHMQGKDFKNPFRMYGVEKSLTLTNPVPGGEVSSAALDQVQVNAYDSSEEVREVRYQVDGAGPWYRMKSSGEMTWFGERRGRPLSAGEHSISIEAVDETGARWTKSASFTVTTDKPAVPVAGEDWAQHHGNERHSGVAASELDPNLELAWSYRTPGTFHTGSPVIVDGVVYAGTRDEDGDGNAAVHAVDLKTGKRLWEFEMDSSVHRTVAVHDGVVYAQSLRSRLHALDAATGKQLWMREPEGTPEPYNQRTTGYYGVTVADGKVFWTHQERFGVGSRGVIAALDSKSGETIWESPMVSNGPAGGTPVVADGRVYVGNGGDNGGKVLAYDLATGEQLWASSNALGGTGSGVPTVADGRVFVGEDNAIIARDAATGEDLWLHRSGGTSYHSNDATPATAAVADGTVYMGFPDGRVSALNAVTGQVAWTKQLPGRFYFGGVFASPVVSGDTLYLGSNNGHMYALDRATGEQLWDYETGAWNAAGPAISGNTMVFGSWDGNLYAFTQKK